MKLVKLTLAYHSVDEYELGMPMKFMNYIYKFNFSGEDAKNFKVCPFNDRYQHTFKTYITTDEKNFQVGDKCLFYGQISEVLESYGNGVVQIKTKCKYTKEEQELLKTNKEYGEMVHGFSESEMPKVLVSEENVGYVFENDKLVNLDTHHIQAIVNNGYLCWIEMENDLPKMVDNKVIIHI